VKLGILLTLIVCLAGCATAPRVAVVPELLQDALFAAPTQPVSGDEVFALSEEMREYLRSAAAGPMRAKGRARGLIDALYTRGELRLEYDAMITRNAAEAFAARAGNCLSLVLMTAAFARELGLQVDYQRVITDETWSRSGNLHVLSGHVNLTLGRRLVDAGARDDASRLTVDFLPPEQIRGLRTQRIAEDTVVAMYLNNRAAETLVQGRLDDAYWWAREAVLRSPAFMSAYNTLGVIYQRHGNLAQAVQAFNHVLGHEPDNTRAMSNLAQALTQANRVDEARTVMRRLAELEPHPPFHFFQLGQSALSQGDFKAARDLFAKEVARADYLPELHFWLGVASFQLGAVDEARKHLGLAMANSTRPGDRDLYAAKLTWLNRQP
jgi:Flp pilus assembly protein TadD